MNSELNRELDDFYELEVQAADRGINQLTGTCTVWVNIIDVNDVAPVFDPVVPQSIAESKFAFSRNIIGNLL